MAEEQTPKLSQSEILHMAAEVVSAYVSFNQVQTSQIPELITSVYATLSQQQEIGAEPPAEVPKPAVSVRRSITPDYIVCLEDGKRLKMLKRHLRSAYDMSPDEYRARWNLAADYPMVAPNYAKQRSDFAKKIGLGRKRSRSRK